MGKIFTVVLLLFSAVCFQGCGGTRTRPVMQEGVWGDIVPSDLFDACLKTLHNREYMIQAVSRDAGLLTTDWYPFMENSSRIGEYKMNLLIFSNEKDETVLSIKINGRLAPEEETDWADREKAQKRASRSIREQIKEVFTDIGEKVGRPTFTRQFSLELEQQ